MPQSAPVFELKSGISDSITAALHALGYGAKELSGTIDFSKEFGDISCSVSFSLARELKKSPNAIANEIKARIKMPRHVESITVENGFINFHLSRKEFSQSVIVHASNPDSLKVLSDSGKGVNVIIEYPSANPIHPLHVGHLRNALLGDSLSRTYRACGYKVEREDYIDDFGLQMVQAMWGHLHLEAPSDKKFDHRIGKLYVETNKRMENADMKKELSDLTQLIEQDGTYESTLTREVAEACVRAQYETLFNYGIYHDVLVWESDIVKDRLLEKAMHILSNTGLIEKVADGEYKGCVVMDLEKIKDLPKEFRGLKENIKVLVRSDGTPTYVAKDIAFHMWKFGMLENDFKYTKFMDRQRDGTPLYSTAQTGERVEFGNMKRAINIIDVRQSHPQELLKIAFRGMGKKEIADNIIHFAYGKVDLEEGALAGRKGTWIGNTADELLEEAITKASTLIGSKLEHSKEDEERIARNVALAAIKFEFLKYAPEKSMTFSWKVALSFDGNSGAYAQYMHARASRILDDAPTELLSRSPKETPEISDSEFGLVKTISRANEVAEKAAQELRPNVITEYINDLSYAFSRFYDQCSILKADSEKEKAFRLALTLSFRNTIKTMLMLIGIDALERM
jgi:arginyl-tRNA synthetase